MSPQALMTDPAAAIPTRSPQQRRLLALEREAPLLPFRVQCGLRIRGGVDPRRLEEAVEGVVSCHEILRSAPPYVFRRETPEGLDRLRLGAAGALERRLRRAPGGDPGTRTLDVRWCEDGGRGTRWLFTLPAINGDGRSLLLILDQVLERYGGGAPAVDESPQYPDLATWLNELAAGNGGDRARRYWEELDLSEHRLPALPFEAIPDPARPFEPVLVERPLDPDLLRRLEAHACDHRTGVREVVTAGWAALLSRLSGRQRMVVGVGFEGRGFEEIAAALGPLARALPVEIELDRELPWPEFLDRIRESVAVAGYRQDYFSWASRTREDGPQPFLPYTVECTEVVLDGGPAGPELELESWYECRERAAATLSAVLWPERPVLQLYMARGVLGEEDGRFLLERLEECLAGAVSDPGVRLADLAPAPGDRVPWTEGVTRGGEAPGRERGVGEVLLGRLEARPEAIVVVDDRGALSAAELSRRSRRLAGRLVAAGVSPGSPVAVCLHRSTALPEALLGILEAGGAYVPLDPSYPARRLLHALDDSGAAVLVTEGHAVAEPLTTERPGLTMVRLDEEGTPAPTSSGRGVAPDQLAYILYTSGSTGRPKGVAVPHRAILNRLLWMVEELPFDPTDAVLQKTPAGFDASLWELLVPMLTGGRVVIAAPSAHRSPAGMARAVERHRVTVLQLVPSLLGPFLDATEGSLPASLRAVFCGGEELGSDLVSQYQTARGDAVLHNLYGPTEAAIDATHWRCDPDLRHCVVPIGRPLANLETLVLSADLGPVALGCLGELHLGGIGLARGYHRLPRATAERFVPHPWRRTPGARLYRTGDLVRRRPDGALQYFGRADQQLKIWGVRTEPAEVEACLRRHPAVDETVIVAEHGADGEPTLAAYVVCGDDSPSDESLREWLREELPEAMVPGSFTAVEEIPRTPSGKLDRAALPEPRRRNAAASPVRLAPSTPEEVALAEIWRDVLRVESFDTRDSFFGLGGDSILSLQVIARARRRGLQLTVEDLFEEPTIEGLGRRVSERPSEASAEEAAAGSPDAAPAKRFPVARLSAAEVDRVLEEFPDTEDLYPLAPVQQGMLFQTLEAPRSGTYCSQIRYVVRGELDLTALQGAWRALIRRHPILRTAILWSQLDEPHQAVLREAEVPWHEEDWSGLPTEELDHRFETLLRTDRTEGFDLSRPPLLRVRVLRTGPDEHRVVLSHHHILLDGWSIALLLGELETLYAEAVDRVERSRPPAPPFRDYIAWWLRQDLDSGREFWRSRLRGLSGPTKLRLERPEPGVEEEGAVFEVRELSLHPGETERLERLARDRELTPSTLVEGAWAILLSRYSRSEEVVFGCTFSGRPAELPGVEEMMGVFINTLPMRVAVPPGTRLLPWLETLQAETWKVRRYEHVPLVRIHGWSALPREQALFDAIFVFDRFDLRSTFQAPDAPGPQIGEVSALTPNHYPLTLSVMPGDELKLTLLFDRRRYREDDVQRMLVDLRGLVEGLVERPEARIQALELEIHGERNRLVTDPKSRKPTAFSKSAVSGPKPVEIPLAGLVDKRPLDGDGDLPLLLEPTVPGVDLAEWAWDHRDEVERDLAGHGGLLFRGFDVASAQELETFARSVCSELFEEYGDLPSRKDSRRVYDATPYPPDRTILFHNEASHTHRWPRKQMFLCRVAAEEGGESVIVDGRSVYARLPAELREPFERLGLRYVRNFTEEFDVRWQDFFRTDERDEVERYCRHAGIEWEWKEDDGLRIANRAPAVIRHPESGEIAWFNQIQLHHVSCLDPETRESLLESFSEIDLPRNVYFGDGTPIPDEVVAEIGRLLEEEATSILLGEGDLLLVDNLLVAHSRRPYRGRREVLVAMGDTTTAADLSGVASEAGAGETMRPKGASG